MQLKFLLLFSFLVPAFTCHAQQKHAGTSETAITSEEFDIVRASIYYPHAIKLRRVKVAIVIQKFKFPEQWLEGAYHVPFINAVGRIGLRRGFTAQASLGTVVVSNQLQVGFRWNKRFDDKFSFNIGYDIGGVYGGLSFADFNTRVGALIHDPTFAFGYRYKDIAFTVKTNVSIVGHVTIKTGENVISDETGFYNGFSVGIYMEQRLWKNHVAIFGLRNNYNKFNYIAWPAFSTFNRFYNTPELSIGLVL